MSRVSDRRKKHAAQVASRAKVRRRTPIRPQTGKMNERRYAVGIQQLIAPMFKAINEQLRPILAGVVAQAKAEKRVDGKRRFDRAYSEVITQAMNGVRLTVTGTTPEPRIAQLVAQNGQAINKFSAQQTDATFRSVLGVAPVRAEPYIASQLATFQQRNVALIKSISTKYLDDVETIVRLGVDKGQSIAEIGKAITQKSGAAKKRANFIARDQVQKFNGQLNKLRQEEVGVTHYIWSTSRDVDVRDEHADRQGQKFAWNDPPEDGHPGDAPNCRCSAIPVMDDFIADVDKLVA